jgi:hypothetical protein
MKIANLFFVIAVVFGINSYTLSQDNGSQTQNVSDSYKFLFLKPFSTGIGTVLNSGFVGGLNPSPYSEKSFSPHFYAGVKFCQVQIPEEDKKFDLNYQTTINYNGVPTVVKWNISGAPTVFGNNTPPVVNRKFTFRGREIDTSITLIGGFDNSKYFSLFIPQVGFGTYYGTDIIVRGLPGVSLSNYGSLYMYGGAIRHSISSYLKLPLDISIQAGLEKLYVKEHNSAQSFSANSSFVNFQLSKTLFFLTFYGGVQYEKYDMIVNYKFMDYNFVFNQSNVNSVRSFAGMTLSLGLMKINSDINYNKRLSISTGVGLSL